MGRTFTIICISLVVAGVVLGLVGRFNGLGNRPLGVDEYYFAQSVNFILEEGVPKFPSGGYYCRGLLLQYITAAAALIFGKTALAYRLPTVLFSLATIALCYIYSRRFLGRVLAGTLVLMLLVSSWHIEFARFARMYSAFQCLTLLFLILVDEAFFNKKWFLRYVPHVILVLATFTHVLGVLLTPFLFVPLLFGRTENRLQTPGSVLRFTAAGLLTTSLCYMFTRINFRDRGVSDLFPEGFVERSWVTFRLPEFPFWSVCEDPLANLCVLFAVLLLTGTLLLLLKHKKGIIKITDIVLALLGIVTAAHMFTLSFIFLVLLFFRYNSHHHHRSPRFYLPLVASFVLFLSWISLALISKEWITRLNGDDLSLLGALRRTFFGWPDFYSPIFIPWSRELPLLSVLIFGALAYQIASKNKKSYSVPHPRACIHSHLHSCVRRVST